MFLIIVQCLNKNRGKLAGKCQGWENRGESNSDCLVYENKSEMNPLQKNLMKSRLPPLAPRSAKNAPGRQKDYSPTEWRQYFHDFLDVRTDEKSSFRCYRSKPAETSDAPVLVLLHGGGFNALSWAIFSVSEFIHDLNETLNFS
jgi:hypothetical protein